MPIPRQRVARLSLRPRGLALVVASFAWLSVAVLHALAQSTAASFDAWCGTGNAELPRLWERTWVELEALEAMPAAAAWTNAPARVGRLLRNVAFLQRGSVGQGTEVAGAVQSTLQDLAGLRTPLIEAAHLKQLDTFTQALAGARAQLNELQSGYPSAVLRASVPPQPSAPPTLKLESKIAPITAKQPVELKFRLSDANGRGVSSLALLETHTRKLHAFLVDAAFEDFHHEHPITAGAPGTFSFHFTPRKPGDYSLWLEVRPQATGRNESLTTVVRGSAPAEKFADDRTRLEWTADGYRFELKLPGTIAARRSIGARLRVTDEQGVPCFSLEPFMGDFAHIVGIMDDRKTLLHVHSHIEPPGENERSGPDVPFHFTAPRPGFLRLFVQTKIEGATRTARFVVRVE